MFLASCTTDDAAGITDNGDTVVTLTIEDCPADQLDLVTDATSMATVDWVNPAGADFTITSIGIAHTDSTVTDLLPELDAESTSATLPSVGDYTVTITAASTEDATVTETCSFAVTVSEPAFTATCLESVDISLTSAGTPIDLSEDNTSVTATNAEGTVEVTWEFDPASVTTDNVGSQVPVTATARDTDGNVSNCNFNVMVNPAGTPEFTTDCPADITMDLSTGNTLEVSWTAPVASVPDSSDAVTYSSMVTSATLSSGTASGTTPDLSSQDNAPSSAAFPVGVSTVTITATNSNAPDGVNPISCSFTVTVQPTVTLTCEVTTTSPSTTMDETVEVEWTATPVVAGVNNPTTTITYLATAETDTMTDAPTIAADATNAMFPVGTFNVMGTASYTLADGVDPATEDCMFMVTVTATPFVLDMPGVAPGAENPFLIQNTNDLAMLATVVNAASDDFTINGEMGNYRTANYRLEEDIDVPAGETGSMDEVVPEGKSNFTPIGTSTSTAFQGNFDGNSNTISGLRFNSNTSSVGLFARVSNAMISNLALTNVNIKGSSSVGGLVGILRDSKVMNVFVAGTVTGTGSQVGGLAGEARTSSRLINTATSVSVTASTSSGGGLVGDLATATVINASASGTVKGLSVLGGLIGTVTGNNNRITNAIAWGRVTRSSGMNMDIGGLIGRLPNSASVTITNSYWQSNTGGATRVCGSGTCASNVGRTSNTLQMPTMAEGIYADWNETSLTVDSDTIMLDEAPWDFGDGSQYPRLSSVPVSLADQRTLAPDTDTTQ